MKRSERKKSTQEKRREQRIGNIATKKEGTVRNNKEIAQKNKEGNCTDNKKKPRIGNSAGCQHRTPGLSRVFTIYQQYMYIILLQVTYYVIFVILCNYIIHKKRRSPGQEIAVFPAANARLKPCQHRTLQQRWGERTPGTISPSPPHAHQRFRFMLKGMEEARFGSVRPKEKYKTEGIRTPGTTSPSPSQKETRFRFVLEGMQETNALETSFGFMMNGIEASTRNLRSPRSDFHVEGNRS